MPEPVVVRMFNEYGCPWPFFGPESLLARDEFPLPSPLAERVLAWTADFDAHYDHERGWPGLVARDASHAEGRRLAAAVQEAVGDGYRIQLELWDTAVAGDL